LKHLHLPVWHVVCAVPDAAEEVAGTRRENVGCLASRVRELRAGTKRKRKIMKDECAPGMLINCTSFRVAPRIWESFGTRRVMFASVIMIDCIVSASDVAERRKISEAAS
jgi:hypothetical protein